MPQYYDLNAVESESIMIGNDWDFLRLSKSKVHLERIQKDLR